MSGRVDSGAHGISAAFIGSSLMLGLALICIVALIIKPAVTNAERARS